MHNLELMESLSLLFMMKVMALHFGNDSYKVMTNSSSYYLQIVVIDISLQFHKYNDAHTIGVRKGYV
jgi:hypothetical protein